MNIGIPRERRPYEFRVGLTPAAVNLFASQGHLCYVEHNAGLGAGFSDQDYEVSGARIVYSSHEVFGRADLVIKVARPLLDELEWLRPGTILIGMLHLASARQDKLQILLEKEITALAFEQIQLPDGSLPVLRPMSQIGGRMAAQVAAMLLQNNSGGKGILLGGIAGVPPAEVVIIGAGVVGSYAMQTFLGMGAHVTMLDTDLRALQAVHERHLSVSTMVSNSLNLERVCRYADVLVGAVLLTGERAPIVITREMVRIMKPRTIIMDISIDQGGCVETSRPTTHEHPTFIEEGVIHYCVPNIPGVAARTATYALVNAALPYVEKVANLGVEAALAEDAALAKALTTKGGELYNLTRLSVGEAGE
jgi:alanine dehydrogenase